MVSFPFDWEVGLNHVP